MNCRWLVQDKLNDNKYRFSFYIWEDLKGLKDMYDQTHTIFDRITRHV